MTGRTQQAREEWEKAKRVGWHTRMSDAGDALAARVAELEEKRRFAVTALEVEWKRLLDSADEDDEDGVHIGFARYARAKADGIGFALATLRVPDEAAKDEDTS